MAHTAVASAPEPWDSRLVRARLAARDAAAQRPSRAGDRRTSRPELPRWLDRCDPGTEHSPAAHHLNGQVPLADLCRLPGTDHLLHGDAARGWWALNRAFVRRFDTSMCITDSYRSLDQQASLYSSKPGLAAVPGTSNHGWGVALDLCGGIESYASPQHQWLRRFGVRFGWVNPDWAQQYGTRPEPWHWEYVGS